MPGGGGGMGGRGLYAKMRGGAEGEGGGEGGTSEYLCRKAPFTKTSPGAFSSTFWMTPQLSALALQNSLSMAVIPPAKVWLRARARVCVCVRVLV